MRTKTKFRTIAELMEIHAKMNFEKDYFELTSQELDTLILWMQLVNYRGQHYGKSKSRSFYDTLRNNYKI